MPDTMPQPAPEILRAVFKAIDDVNELLDPDNQLTKSLDTPLIGPDAGLDSMAFVNLIAAVEDRMGETLGTTICFADQGVGIDRKAFRTVGTLAEYIARTLLPRRHEN
jgi:acyl carrier protein